MKKLISVLLVVAMLFAFAACAATTPAAEATEAPVAEATEAPVAEATEAPAASFVGISMPTQDLQRWNQDGANMKEKFEAAGYTVDLQYANNEVATQVSQIENMISAGVNVLVIAAIDGKTLTSVLATAKDAGIYVIAYDRLIMDTDAVNYYCTFDNYMVGTIQGQYIKDSLKLDEGGKYNMEITAGDPADNNALYFYQGAIDVLQPYIDSGVLTVVSGQVAFADVATAAWSTETSQARMEAILASYYADGTQLDACLCSNDSTAKGVTNALASSYTGAYPIVTGQDCDVANTKDIIAGKQSMSIFKDTRTLAAQTVTMVSDLLAGKTPEVNDTKSYDNGTGIIPTYLCAPVFADINNYKELLIDSGSGMKEKLGIKSPSVEQDVGNLSGGNQQKVLLSKWMFAEPNILILDEPTRGIDVGAKYEIYCIINDLVAAGKSVIMISSEMPEVLGMCDRIYVMSEAKIVGEMDARDATQELIMSSILSVNKGA